MAKGQRGFYWKSDTLSGGLKQFPAKLDRAIVSVFEYEATRAETHAKTEAPWTDQSSNARNDLFTATEHVPLKSHTLIVSHGPNIPYGKWLEIRWAGKYAIIMPTVKVAGSDIMRLLNGLLESGVKLR